jgi:hypothetical protein
MNDRTHISLKSVKVRSWCTVVKRTVQFLLPDGRLPVEAKYSKEIGSLDIIFDEADYTTMPFVPCGSIGWISKTDLNHS